MSIAYEKVVVCHDEPSNEGHLTKLIVIAGKELQIDEDLVPFIKWLNSHGCKTLRSRQGDYHVHEKECFKKPFVSFVSRHGSVMSILKTVENYNAIANSHVKVEANFDKKFPDDIKFTISWFDRLDMRNFLLEFFK